MAREALAGAPGGVARSIDTVARLVDMLETRGARVPVHFDFAELRGYRYHSGVVFAAFVPGQGQEVARGGRYDDIERVFGEPRAATGFSTDLKTLVTLADLIEAPWSGDAQLLARVASLRASGERVVFALPGERMAPGCSRRLVHRGGEWTVVSIDGEQPRT